MNSAALLLTILFAGLASQWFAWRVRLPAIVVLIAAGLAFGPVTGLIKLDLPPHDLSELIGLGVAIILFEGGMDLKLEDLRRAGKGIGRLTLLGPPLAWLLGSFAAHHIAGLSWPVSWVLGAILVVTGPTVIMPLLRQVSLNKESASLLKWEGIVNDPIGVLLAVLAFQYFTIAGSGMAETAAGVGLALAVMIVLGGGGGWLTGWVYQRGLVPEHLKAPLLLVLVLFVYSASNMVQHEAGLLSVTAMGLILGNMKLVDREDLMRFKENLTVILLSVLFIVIPSQLDRQLAYLIDFRMILFVLAVLLVVRPLTIMLATIGAPMRMADRKLLSWIAPRGIVAAATAGIFGPALVAAGLSGRRKTAADRLSGHHHHRSRPRSDHRPAFTSPRPGGQARQRAADCRRLAVDQCLRQGVERSGCRSPAGGRRLSPAKAGTHGGHRYLLRRDSLRTCRAHAGNTASEPSAGRH
ncbi:MAG: cation:proton antiporter [Propionivibrio sp.]|nr:cation:proton antiporter [Propionivibrio sp.]